MRACCGTPTFEPVVTATTAFGFARRHTRQPSDKRPLIEQSVGKRPSKENGHNSMQACPRPGPECFRCLLFGPSPKINIAHRENRVELKEVVAWVSFSVSFSALNQTC